MKNFTPQSHSMKKEESHPNVSTSSIDSTNVMYVKRLVIELSNHDLRENALDVLCKMKDMFEDLAPLLWNSFGVPAIFLQEIISIYPILSTPDLLTRAKSTRVCKSLALLQCVASHPDTKLSFLKANMAIYLYPYLGTTYKLAPFEDLRLFSLGVIAAMVKVKTREVIDFLLASEVMELCLTRMEVGREMSQTFATFIVEKILSDDVGMAYVCVAPDRYSAVLRALRMCCIQNQSQPSPNLMGLLISCDTHLREKSQFYLPRTTSPPFF